MEEERRFGADVGSVKEGRTAVAGGGWKIIIIVVLSMLWRYRVGVEARGFLLHILPHRCSKAVLPKFKATNLLKGSFAVL